MVGLEVRKEALLSPGTSTIGAIPLTVFLAERKDGLACWEQLFFYRGASWSHFLVQAGCAGATGVQVVLTLTTNRGIGLVFHCFLGRWWDSWEQSPNSLHDLIMEDSCLVGQSFPVSPWSWQ